MDLVLAAGLVGKNSSAEAARLLALELYRGDKVSLGRASELCRMSVEQLYGVCRPGTAFRLPAVQSDGYGGKLISVTAFATWSVSSSCQSCSRRFMVEEQSAWINEIG